MTKRLVFGLCAIVAVVCARNRFALQRDHVNRAGLR
jgi:hypothetical protein